jgi:hypothetical protein
VTSNHNWGCPRQNHSRGRPRPITSQPGEKKNTDQNTRTFTGDDPSIGRKPCHNTHTHTRTTLPSKAPQAPNLEQSFVPLHRCARHFMCSLTKGRNLARISRQTATMHEQAYSPVTEQVSLPNLATTTLDNGLAENPKQIRHTHTPCSA